MKEPSSPLRRKLVNSVWATPVVMAVTLPAHAESSPTDSGSMAYASPGTYSLTVPTGVCEVQVSASGAAGGAAHDGAGGSSFPSPYSSSGGLSTGTIDVESGDVLTIIVGAKGGDSTHLGGTTLGGAGYGNGGGASEGAGGGGGSAVLQAA